MDSHAPSDIDPRLGLKAGDGRQDLKGNFKSLHNQKSIIQPLKLL